MRLRSKSYNSHTPLFPMENKKLNAVDDELSLYINRIVRPIFEKVANETPINRVSVGGGRSEKNKIALYCPHFYRLYIDFSKKDFNPLPFIKTDVKRSVAVTYKLKNHNSEHQYTNFCNCRITVKKNQIEVQNYIDNKKKYVVDIAESSMSQMSEILQQKDIECLYALTEFIKIYGGSSKFEILKRKGEHKLYGTTGINAIHPKTTFHNDIVKSVYNERNAEYYEPIHAMNHLVNTGVIEVVPSLVKAINSLAYNINPLRTLKSLIKTINNVIKNKELIIKLSNKERNELTKWLFLTNFGDDLNETNQEML